MDVYKIPDLWMIHIGNSAYKEQQADFGISF